MSVTIPFGGRGVPTTAAHEAVMVSAILLAMLGGCGNGSTQTPSMQQGPAALTPAPVATVPADSPPLSCAPIPSARDAPPTARKSRADGVETHRFIEIADKKFVHGVDVSRNAETANFARIHECGGAFAYIRMSYGNGPWIEDRWRPLWLRAVYEASDGRPLVRGGYHVLTFKIETQRAAATSARDWENLARAEAKDQARVYGDRLMDVLKSGGDRAMLPVALALFKAEIQDVRKSRSLYRTGVCAWFREVQQRLFPLRMKHVVLRGASSLLEELDLTDLTCDGVAPISLWLDQYTSDGGEPGDSPTSSLYRVCAKTQRCLFHKYSSRGRMTLAEDKEFVGLDRFLGDRAQFEAALIHVRQ